MANADAQDGRAYAWMASVRASMDNDSSRKIFESQVQSHAFVFLDDYLEHILAGPRQDPIIELAKTPGRKRMPHGTRTATTAATAALTSPLPISNAPQRFPTLPAPSPLHKFAPVMPEAPATSLLPTVAVPSVPLGKRTSWLTKAREAKAMEGTSSLPGASVVTSPTGLLRVPTEVEVGIVLFKRTVEDLGARAGKSMSRPLGDAAVAALAEARAAAEARVAERNKISNESNDAEASHGDGPPDQVGLVRSPPSKGSSGFVKLAGPVFNKPPPPPSLGVPARVATVCPTQDTEYTDDWRPLDLPPAAGGTDNNDDDDDDSWPIEEKLAAVEPGWRPFDFSNVDKEDTWSSLPTESQGTTRRLTAETYGDAIHLSNNPDVEVGDENEGLEREQEAMETSDVEHSIMDIHELDGGADAGTAGPRETDSEGTSQTSVVSAASSQPQVGFFSQATKLVGNMLGGSKKVKPELKSLQLAAAAAKRQQEEADKRIQRLKEMEARRQGAIAKKAEEERTRVLEEHKKNREELERRKREREETTDRRPLKPPVSTKKADEDASKKRKLAPETEKKQESKNPSSKDKDPPTRSAVTPTAKLTVAKKGSTMALVSSAAYNATQNLPSAKPIVPEAKPFKVVGKAKAKPREDDMGDKLPSTMVQSQMAARAKVQMQAAQMPTPAVPSESIELPEINSEYSDSDDEDRVRTFDPPEWAQSPELRQALQIQSTVNPDDIFGGIRPLRMEEMFRTRQSRFRARTSSANWAGSDRLTVEEIREYERRMGFQQTRAS